MRCRQCDGEGSTTREATRLRSGRILVPAFKVVCGHCNGSGQEPECEGQESLFDG